MLSFIIKLFHIANEQEFCLIIGQLEASPPPPTPLALPSKIIVTVEKYAKTVQTKQCKHSPKVAANTTEPNLFKISKRLKTMAYSQNMG
jgi:hypothetical protein